MAEHKGLVLLDRDGVLNRICVDEEHGTIDSPLARDQVKLVDGAASALRRLRDAGYALAICTNQPAAAKRKTTRENLEAVHAAVVEGVGGVDASFICFHRAEDGCACRKPKPGMLLDALSSFAMDPARAWMVGDGVTDLEAGRAAGVRIAFVGPRKCDACAIVRERVGEPDLWVDSIVTFADTILGANP